MPTTFMLRLELLAKSKGFEVNYTTEKTGTEWMIIYLDRHSYISYWPTGPAGISAHFSHFSTEEDGIEGFDNKYQKVRQALVDFNKLHDEYFSKQ